MPDSRQTTGEALAEFFFVIAVLALALLAYSYLGG